MIKYVKKWLCSSRESIIASTVVYFTSQKEQMQLMENTFEMSKFRKYDIQLNNTTRTERTKMTT